MKKQWFAITITVATATTALLGLFWLMGNTVSGISAPALAAPLSLTVTAVDPAVAPNDLDTPITIIGTGFATELTGTLTLVITQPRAYLGTTALDDASWVNTTTLNATIPWGMAPKVYSLTVVNPDGISSTLQNAFTVTNGVGVFTTDGPYGGYIVGLEKKPGTPTTVYAVASEVGLFVSKDSGAHWELGMINNPLDLAFDAQDGNVIYSGSDTWLYRTMDGGDTWEALPQIYPGQQVLPTAHPSSAGVVYLGIGSLEDIPFLPGEGGVFRSDDYGMTWITKTNGMTDTDVQSIAIHPNDPNKMLAGTWDGNVYASLNGGENWSLSAPLTDPVMGLYFNPYQSLQAWATGGKDIGEPTTYLYTSTNLTDWTEVIIEPGAMSNYGGWDLDFLTDTIWVSGSSIYTSTDGGGTWTNPDLAAIVVAVTPENPQEIYAGTEFGVDKSEDGGQTWQQINDGLAGLVPSAVATSPIDPDLVFVRTSQGLYRSFNGGRAWQDLGCCGGGGGTGGQLAIDPYTPTRIYLGTRTICNDDQFCIRISPDSGDTWEIVTATLPVTYTGFGGGPPEVVAPHPLIPGRMLAGSNVQDSGNPDNHFGMVYASDDYGQSWAYMGPTQPISSIIDIAYDAVDPNLVYMATIGSGQWKSTDGGVTWIPLSFTLAGYIYDVIAPHSTLSGHLILHASSQNNTSGLYSSQDAGETWTLLPDGNAGSPLIYAPTLPPTLYAFGLGDGHNSPYCLRRSVDNGLTWKTVAGAPGPTRLATATDGKRVVLYIGSPGGLASQAGAQTTLASRAVMKQSTLLGSGVYRLTTLLPTDWVYLPLVVRGYVP